MSSSDYPRSRESGQGNPPAGYSHPQSQGYGHGPSQPAPGYLGQTWSNLLTTSVPPNILNSSSRAGPSDHSSRRTSGHGASSSPQQWTAPQGYAAHHLSQAPQSTPGQPATQTRSAAQFAQYQAQRPGRFTTPLPNNAPPQLGQSRQSETSPNTGTSSLPPITAIPEYHRAAPDRSHTGSMRVNASSRHPASSSSSPSLNSGHRPPQPTQHRSQNQTSTYPPTGPATFPNPVRSSTAKPASGTSISHSPPAGQAITSTPTAQSTRPALRSPTSQTRTSLQPDSREQSFSQLRMFAQKFEGSRSHGTAQQQQQQQQQQQSHSTQAQAQPRVLALATQPRNTFFPEPGTTHGAHSSPATSRPLAQNVQSAQKDASNPAAAPPPLWSRQLLPASTASPSRSTSTDAAAAAGTPNANAQAAPRPSTPPSSSSRRTVVPLSASQASPPRKRVDLASGHSAGHVRPTDLAKPVYVMTSPSASPSQPTQQAPAVPPASASNAGPIPVASNVPGPSAPATAPTAIQATAPNVAVLPRAPASGHASGSSTPSLPERPPRKSLSPAEIAAKREAAVRAAMISEGLDPETHPATLQAALAAAARASEARAKPGRPKGTGPRQLARAAREAAETRAAIIAAGLDPDTVTPEVRASFVPKKKRGRPSKAASEASANASRQSSQQLSQQPSQQPAQHPSQHPSQHLSQHPSQQPPQQPSNATNPPPSSNGAAVDATASLSAAAQAANMAVSALATPALAMAQAAEVPEAIESPTRAPLANTSAAGIAPSPLADSTQRGDPSPGNMPEISTPSAAAQVASSSARQPSAARVVPSAAPVPQVNAVQVAAAEDLVSDLPEPFSPLPADEAPAAHEDRFAGRIGPVNRVQIVIPITSKRRAELISRGVYDPFRDDADPNELERASRRPRKVAKVAPMTKYLEVAVARGAALRQQKVREPEIVRDRFAHPPEPPMAEPFRSVLTRDSLLNRIGVDGAYKCDWKGCGAELASEALLLRHVMARNHAQQAAFDFSNVVLYQCHWRGCDKPSFRSADKLLQHLTAKHVSEKLVCPYGDCDLRSSTISHLHRHVARTHDDGGQPRPRVDLVFDNPLPDPEPLPATVTAVELTMQKALAKSCRTEKAQEHAHAKVLRLCIAPPNPEIHITHPPHMLEKVEGDLDTATATREPTEVATDAEDGPGVGAGEVDAEGEGETDEGVDFSDAPQDLDEEILVETVVVANDETDENYEDDNEDRSPTPQAVAGPSRKRPRESVGPARVSKRQMARRTGPGVGSKDAPPMNSPRTSKRIAELQIPAPSPPRSLRKGVRQTAKRTGPLAKEKQTAKRTGRLAEPIAVESDDEESAPNERLTRSGAKASAAPPSGNKDKGKGHALPEPEATPTRATRRRVSQAAVETPTTRATRSGRAPPLPAQETPRSTRSGRAPPLPKNTDVETPLRTTRSGRSSGVGIKVKVEKTGKKQIIDCIIVPKIDTSDYVWAGISRKTKPKKTK